MQCCDRRLWTFNQNPRLFQLATNAVVATAASFHEAFALLGLDSKHTPAHLPVIFNLLLPRWATWTFLLLHSCLFLLPFSATLDLNFLYSTQLSALIYLPLPHEITWTFILLRSCLFFIIFLCHVGSIEFSSYAAAFFLLTLLCPLEILKLPWASAAACYSELLCSYAAACFFYWNLEHYS